MNEEDYEEEEWEDEYNYDLCRICSCGRATIGEVCGQCGTPLCVMCYEMGAGFCKKHPDENYQPPEY